MTCRITALVLDSFKSIKNSRLDVDNVTFLSGRNGSGKSNVIDALAVLSALADGQQLRAGQFAGVRGGLDGCAPFGENRFALGVDLDWNGSTCEYRVEIHVGEEARIASESLHVGGKKLLGVASHEEGSGDTYYSWNNQKQGPDPQVRMRNDRSALGQVPAQVPAQTTPGRWVHDSAEAVIHAMRSVFLLDPVSHMMRNYVPRKVSTLDRNGLTLSAVLARISEDPDGKATIMKMLRRLSETQIEDISVISSDLGDVMIAVHERIGGEIRRIPARLLSDGTLRFLAIAAALLDDTDSAPGERILVVEEIENGLHPSQAALLVETLKEAFDARGVRTIATTHSPAIMDSLRGAEHHYLAVASRDKEGWTRIHDVVDMPNYFDLTAAGTLGDAAINDDLRPRVEPETSPFRFEVE